MESALTSETKAKQYMESAFSGTPEGYETLLKQVEMLDIQTSTDTNLHNTKPGGYRLNELVGATVQNGELSADNPIALENTFDCVEMISGARAWNNGVIANNTKSVYNKYSIPCKSGDVVKVVAENVTRTGFIFYDNNGNHLSYEWNDASEITSTVPNGATSFDFNVVSNVDITPQNVGKITLTVNGKYVGQIVEHGKNLFIKSKATDGYGCGSTGVPYADSTLSVSDYIEVDSTKKYAVYGIQWVNWFDEKRSHIKTGSGSVLTPPSNAKYIRITYSLSLKDKVQLEVGETVTEYEEGKEIVTTFFLNEPLRATPDGTKDILFRENGVLKVARYVKEKLLSKLGASTFSVTRKSSGNITALTSSITGDRVCSQAKIMCNCNILRCLTDSASVQAGNIIGLSFNPNTQYQKYAYICIPGDTLEELTHKAFVEWLDSKNAVVQYALNTPTIETLDTASQLALNDMVTFDGVTYIEVDSKVKPTSISGEYGTSKVGAYTLKCMNDNDTDRVERAEMKARLDELAVALVSQ